MQSQAQGHSHTVEYSPIKYPDIDDDAARLDVFEENGRQNAVDSALHEYDALNPVAVARTEIYINQRQLDEIEGEYRRLDRDLRHTHRTNEVITSERIARSPWLHKVEPAVMTSFAGGGLVGSNFILGRYVVSSGSDMFAVDLLAASVFAVTPIMGAVAIKGFERWPPTDSAKDLYRRCFFAVGLVSLILWCFAAATAFGPNVGSPGAWLVAGGTGRSVTITLMVTHLLIDVTFGYIIYAVAVDIILSTRKRIEVPNARFEVLTEAKLALRGEMAARGRAIGDAQDYMESVASGRETTRIKAERAFNRAYQLFDAGEAEAVSRARAGFLNSNSGPQPRTSLHALPWLLLPVWLMLATPADARNLVAVLPENYSGSKIELVELFAGAISGIGHGDQLLIYTARPLSRLAAIAWPEDPKAANSAWLKRKLAEQFAPALAYILKMPGGSSGEPPANLMPPQLLEEIGRNIITSLPGARAEVLLLGSMLHYDARDGRWQMTRRYYPSDGLLGLAPTESVFGIAGAETRLKGATIHWASPEGEREFATAEHGRRVHRWWWLWLTGQSATVGTFSHDVAGTFQRFLAGKVDGQAEHQPVPGTKPEMLQAPAPMPVVLPPDTSRPGAYFLRDDVEIRTTPPTTTVGIAWLGISWQSSCDVDLWARSDKSSQWLFFGRVRTEEGFFNKDYRAGTGEKQFEYIEFTKNIDLAKVEVALNFFSGNLPAGPEGVVRVWFEGSVFQAPWKLEAKSGNRGAMPMSGSPYWLQLDLRKVVGLTPS